MNEYDLKMCACAIRSGLAFSNNDHGISHHFDITTMKEAFALLKKINISWDLEYLRINLLNRSGFSSKLIEDILKITKTPTFGSPPHLKIELVDNWKKLTSDPSFDAIKHLQEWHPIGSKK